MSGQDFDKKIISSTYGEQIIKPATEEDLKSIQDARMHMVLCDFHDTYVKYKDFMKLPFRHCWRLRAAHQLITHSPLTCKVILVAPGYNTTDLWKSRIELAAWEKRANELGCNFSAMETFYFPILGVDLVKP